MAQGKLREGTSRDPAAKGAASAETPAKEGSPKSKPPRRGDTPLAARRIVAIDVYRGLVMFLMMAEVLKLSELKKHFPGSAWAEFISFHTQHVEWYGYSLHDLIQPGFSFLVGAALPFSLAGRRAAGQSTAGLWLHTLWRSCLLVFLGIFLRSNGKPLTHFTFIDTLSQIGLGYPFLFGLAWLRPRWQWLAMILIVVGVWGAWYAYPAAPPEFDRTTVGVKADWPYDNEGALAHWNKNRNLGAAFDRWFMNLFPREAPYEFDAGGYVMLNFIPTLATMILGLIAGGWLRDVERLPNQLLLFALAGAAGILGGYWLHTLGFNPVVKRIWTPAWVLFSGGWCFATLGTLYLLLDVTGVTFWAFPWRVIGANSIAAYCMAGLCKPFFAQTIATHFKPWLYADRSPEFAQRFEGTCTLLIWWLILLWMYRRKIFLRI